jgi:hypothetical protein
MLDQLLNVLLGVPPPRPLLAAPYIDIRNFAVLDQSGELILGDFEPFGGFLAIQQLGHLHASLNAIHTLSVTR